ncbi:MAG TPA: hypothetical protein DCX06_04025 [Opitutae bacterium]|nr:hypothetical protein [Opitutae bacterium]
MKAYLLPLFLLPALLFANYDLRVGDSLKDTIEALGKPLGTIELREKTLLLYPQGEVTFKEDQITALDLMSPEDFKADQERLRKEREEWAIQQEKEAEQRIEQGKQIKAAKTKSNAFHALPAKDRVDYWRSFQIRYPEIDVSEEIARSLEGYEVELKELQAQQRIAELEARVALAEKDAATARLEAEKARDEAEARSRDNYGLRYYTDPAVDRRYYYRPPTVTIYTHGKGDTKTHQHEETKTNRFYRKQPANGESTSDQVQRLMNETSAR